MKNQITPAKAEDSRFKDARILTINKSNRLRRSERTIKMAANIASGKSEVIPYGVVNVKTKQYESNNSPAPASLKSACALILNVSQKTANMTTQNNSLSKTYHPGGVKMPR